MQSTKYKKESFLKVVKESNNLSDVCRKIGSNPKFYGNIQTVKKYIELYKLGTSHFKRSFNNGKNFNKKTLKEILIKNSTFNRGHLKERLYKECLKEKKCELCGQDEIWQGKKMSLILDHINGINNDNRLENLQIVCPNCNATLDTFCRGSKKQHYELNYDKKHNYCSCGKEIELQAKRCAPCNVVSTRRVERPSLEKLLNETKELGFVQVGKKYGVSDNAIRKWINQYQKEN